MLHPSISWLSVHWLFRKPGRFFQIHQFIGCSASQEDFFRFPSFFFDVKFIYFIFVDCIYLPGLICCIPTIVIRFWRKSILDSLNFNCCDFIIGCIFPATDGDVRVTFGNSHDLEMNLVDGLSLHRSH